MKNGCKRWFQVHARPGFYILHSSFYIPACRHVANAEAREDKVERPHSDHPGKDTVAW